MAINLVPLLSYVLISTFTPGPSNISSASMGVLHGYKNTLNYQVGLAVGVFGAMLLSGWLSTTLLAFFPALEPALRYVGAGYITAFLAPLTHNVTLLGVAAFLLAAISFGATSVWALFGTAIKRYLRHPRLQAAVNIILALFLVYTAIALTGLI